MSKRFGRNQRRRLLQQVEILQATSKLEKGLLDHQRTIINLQRRVIERVRHVIGPNFAGLDPETIEAVGHDGFVRLPRLTNVHSFESMSSLNQVVNLESIIHQLEVMQPSLELDRLRGMVHVRVLSPSRQAAYACNEQALSGLGRRHAAELIARELASFLVKELPQ